MSDLDTCLHPNAVPAVAILPLHAHSDHNIQAVTLAKSRVTVGQAALSRMIGRGCRVSLPALDAIFTLHLMPDVSHADWSDALVLSGPDGSIEVGQGGRL